MADSKNQRELNELLKQQVELQTRLNEQLKAAAVLTGKEAQEMEDRVDSSKLALGLIEEEAKRRQKALADNERRQTRINTLKEKEKEYQDELNDLQNDFTKSLSKVQPETIKILEAQKGSGSTFVSITNQILDLKKNEINLSDEDKKINAQKIETLTEIRQKQLEAAEAITYQKQEMLGINDADRRRLEFQQSIVGLSGDDLKLAEDSFNKTEKLIAQQERLNSLSEAGNLLYEKLPAELQSGVDMAKGLGSALKSSLGPIAIILAVAAIALETFVNLQKAAGDFRRETGMTNTQMKGMESSVAQIVEDTAILGVEAKDVYDTIANLKSEFSDITKFSNETVKGLTVLTANFGIASTDAAKVEASFENMGHLSQETATNVALQVAQMANLAGVAPKQIFKDIAEASEETSTYFKGDVKLIAQQAVQARRLGTTLKEMASTAEHLLDFESSIGDELVASTFVGGQFNLARARGLEYAGKEAEAQEEILNQIKRSGDWSTKDMFTKKAIAKATNMSVAEITKQLAMQEKLSNLSDADKAAAEEAIKNGVDITKINKEQLATEIERVKAQKEMQTQVDNVGNSFKAISTTIGTVLMPIIDALTSAINIIAIPVNAIYSAMKSFGDSISSAIGPLGAVGKFVKSLAGVAIVLASYMTYAAISAGLIDTGIGAIAAPIIGGIAAAAILAAGFGALSSINDGMVGPDGGVVVSGQKGSVALDGEDTFVGNKNGVVAGTDLFQGKGKGTAGGNISVSNLSTLSAPLNNLIAEVKGMRDDLKAGKIAVYMDSQKVTNNIGRQADKSTRNNYSFA